ncbi:porin [Oceanisphaera sp. DM8]|uniref:Porin n=2 Tax=Oceanisphaera pacifica TaxID=2818389 RepID=A0ABS3NDY0_9GAMM|nr:porin [Oceanisphaera pacifica]
MKKTILALTIPALFATSASAVEIYSAEDGSKVDLYGRLQYHAGGLGYQGGGERQNFGGEGQIRAGINFNQVLNQDISLIGKYEANFDAESKTNSVGNGKNNANNEIDTRYAWLGFSFQDTTTLTFGKSEAPRAQLTDLTDTLDIFGANVTRAGGFNRVDDQIRVSYAANGLDLRGAYAFNDDRKQDQSIFNNDIDDTRWGVSAGYTLPINLGFVASYNQEDNDYVTAGSTDKTKEWGLGAHYSIDGFYFAGLYGQIDEKNTGLADDDGAKFWELQASYNVEEWTLIANYANAKGRKASSGDKLVDEYTLAARYAFTPKTKIYAEYVINEISDEDDLYGVGIQYNF